MSKDVDIKDIVNLRSQQELERINHLYYEKKDVIQKIIIYLSTLAFFLAVFMLIKELIFR